MWNPSTWVWLYCNRNQRSTAWSWIISCVGLLTQYSSLGASVATQKTSCTWIFLTVEQENCPSISSAEFPLNPAWTCFLGTWRMWSPQAVLPPLTFNLTKAIFTIIAHLRVLWAGSSHLTRRLSWVRRTLLQLTLHFLWGQRVAGVNKGAQECWEYPENRSSDFT